MRRMKDSGVEWIGEIPEGWEVTRLKSCVMRHDGGAWGEEPNEEKLSCVCLRVADMDYENLRFKRADQYTVRGYKPETVRKLLLKKGDIIIEKSGGGENTPVGRAVLFDLDLNAVFSNFQERIRPAYKADSSYLLYLLASMYYSGYIKNYIKQTTGIQNLDFTALLAGEYIGLPTRDEQQCIAAYLDRKCAQIDSILSLQQEAIEKLKEYKLSLITEAVTKGLDPDVSMKDSGIEWIGDVPAHWGVSKIRYAVQKIGSGTTPKSSNVEYYDGDIPWIQSGDLYGKSEIRETKSNVNEMALEHFSALTVYEGRFIVIAMYGASVGNVSISEISACTNQACCAIKTNVLNDLKFMYYWLCACKRNFLTQAEGGSQPNISQTKIRNQVYLQMGIDEQKAIATYLDQKCGQIDTTIAQKQSLISRLTAYKKSLIYEVVTGKKEV